MDWTIQDLGAAGEFVGAIAVVITLVYLAIQIRQGNVAAESAAIQGFFDSWESLGRVDVAMIKVIRKGYTQRWDEISKDEQVQLHMYWAGYLGKLQKGFRLQVRGVLDHPSYIGFEDFLISALKSPALSTWWREYREVFPPDFRDRITSRLDDPNDTRPLMKDILPMWSPD